MQNNVLGSSDLITMLTNKLNRLERDSELLANLLAVIHRDGGDWQEDFGTRQAAVDAMNIVLKLYEASRNETKTSALEER